MENCMARDKERTLHGQNKAFYSGEALIMKKKAGDQDD